MRARKTGRLPVAGAGLALVLGSLVLDLPSDLLRLVFASVVLGVFHRIDAWTDIVVVLFGFGPALRSLAALALPLGAPPALRISSGARRPSGRERDALDSAAGMLPGAALPRQVLIIDSPDENAWVLGETLLISRGLFDGPHLASVVAHEIGHLRSGDGRVALAAWWLPVRSLAWLAETLLGARRAGRPQPGRALPQPSGGALAGQGDPGGPATGGRAPGGCLTTGFRLPAVVLGACLLVASGGLFPMLLRLPWAAYQRRRELAADAYAAALGQGPGLIEALADWQILDVARPWWQGRSHPYVEQRIDQLQRLANQGP